VRVDKIESKKIAAKLAQKSQTIDNNKAELHKYKQ
jgi:hypothetical protein